MHYDYKRPYLSALRKGYRERAFLGSKERRGHTFSDEPLQPMTFFDADEEIRTLASAMTTES